MILSSQKGICFVFGAGEYYGGPPRPDSGDLVVAADGGYAQLMRYKIPADLVVGDFDSLEGSPPERNTVVLPKIKDDTDMAAALGIGWERGYRLFHIYGGTGGRLDHTLANIQCLADLAERGGRGFLFDRETVITAIHNDKISFAASAAGTISVFAHSDRAAGVRESGLGYEAENITLHNNYPVGISNAFIGAPSRVAVEEGTLIVIYPKGAELR